MFNADQQIFQQISHEKSCWFRWGMESSALFCLHVRSPKSWPQWQELPGWRFRWASQVQPWCQKRVCLLSQDVGFTSQVFPEFVKILFLASYLWCLNAQKIFIFLREGQKEKGGKIRERKREGVNRSGYCWVRDGPWRPVLLLEHVIVKQRSTSFTSFFHYSK